MRSYAVAYLRPLSRSVTAAAARLSLVFLLALWGCSRGAGLPLDPGPLADGGSSAADLFGAALDLRGGADLSSRADDPALCPVGAADGCCPLLRNGGSDPDCPSLACAKLSQSAPLRLDPPEQALGNERTGQVGMAWTGSALALAWTYSPEAGKYQVTFERRDRDGALQAGPVVNDIPGSPRTAVSGPTALAYDPQQRAFALVHTATLVSYAALGLSEGGGAAWTVGLGELCNSLWIGVDAFSTSAGWLLAQQNMTCAGSTWEPRVDRVGFDGARQKTWLFGDGGRPQLTPHGVFALDPAKNQLLTIYGRSYEYTLGARVLDLTTGTIAAGQDLLPRATSPYEHQGLAFDGKRYGVLWQTRVSISEFRQWFQIYDPQAGWVGSAVAFAGPRYMMPPSLIWTGDGFMAAMMTVDGETTPLTEPTKLTAQLYSFSPTGQLRETFAVDSGPAAYPKLVWAGGKVALSWVRVISNVDRNQQWLRYLSCP